MKDSGKVGGFRYVPLNAKNDARSDIDDAEFSDWMAVGLQLGLVQHVRYSPWEPRNYSGVEDGAFAGQWARAVGYPERAHLFQDLEGVAGGASGDPTGTIIYSNLWAGRVLQAALGAGLYVGFDIPLTAEQLYEDLSHNCYWSDPARRHVAERSCAIYQGRTRTIAGLTFDEDTVAPDLLGGLPWVAANDTSAAVA